MKKGIGLLVLLILVCGISFAEEIDYGTPIDFDYEVMIKGLFETLLKDPESAKYTFSEPKKCWIDKKIGLFSEKTRREFSGYVINVWVNSKNSFGGYTGRKLYQFLFKNGKIFRVFNEDASLDTYPVIKRFPKENHILHIEE